ncbi:IS110 family transposase [Streptomyces sp. L7]|uniref:IS110 family transposase n=1 Tax=Streptomyces sp. L7 TaxID=3423954 RepID=UPI003D99870A
MDTIVAQSRPYVIGVDTHARTHTYALLAASGSHVGTETFPNTPAGRSRAITGAGRRTGGEADVLWAIEGAGSYGAQLARAVTATGYAVVEAPRVNTRARRGIGKSDPLDAAAIAATVLALPIDRLSTPRQDEGVRAATQILLTARDGLASERTRAVNTLTALLRTIDRGIDARRALSAAKITEASRWRAREEPLHTATARVEAIRLAKRIVELDSQLAENIARIKELVEASPAAELLERTGIGAVTAATALVAWSHRGRVKSEAAYASIAGVNPIPASSGNTTRHRLNRGGDRQLNRALNVIAMVRIIHDPETRAYVERRRADGKTDREIRRIIKSYLAHSIYRHLNTASTTKIGVDEI